MNPAETNIKDPRWISVNLVDFSQEGFRIRSFREKGELIASLDRFGILQAPLLCSSPEGRFAILDGFERLGWAAARGLQEVLARIVPEKVSLEELWRIRIQTLLFGPPLNAVQKADLIQKLSAVFTVEQMQEEFFPLLQVPWRPESLEGWCLLAQQDRNFLLAVALEEISERVALQLVTWEAEARQEAVHLLRELKCSASIQWELVERITEISLREEISPLEVIRDLQEESGAETRRMQPRQKTQALRDLVARRRFPRLKAKEAHFEALLKDASLPRNLNLRHPPFFEGDVWQVHLSFSSPGQLENLTSLCSELARSPWMEELMACGSSKSPKNRRG